MLEDPRQVRLRELENAIADIAHQARAARMALCENELLVRLENIVRRAEAVQRQPEGLESPGDAFRAQSQTDGPVHYSDKDLSERYEGVALATNGRTRSSGSQPGLTSIARRINILAAFSVRGAKGRALRQSLSAP